MLALASRVCPTVRVKLGFNIVLSAHSAVCGLALLLTREQERFSNDVDPDGRKSRDLKVYVRSILVHTQTHSVIGVAGVARELSSSRVESAAVDRLLRRNPSVLYSSSGSAFCAEASSHRLA